jgi:uncharacterized protein
MSNLTLAFSLLLVTATLHCPGQSVPKNYGKIESELFGENTNSRALIVAFGGSEGGNTFGTPEAKDLRSKFLIRGFSFLSIGYFNGKGLPKKLDRISLNAIYDTIKTACRYLKIDSTKIILVGASRGAELALNLASRYPCLGVIALVPPSVSIPSFDNKIITSSWIFDNEEVPYIKFTLEQTNKVGWLKTIEAALTNKEEVASASIEVENIDGFIFLSSGKKDELWPSEQMCKNIVGRLRDARFKYAYEHVSFDGGHQPSKHWDAAFKFLDKNIDREF